MRLRVEKKTLPPGLTSVAQARMVLAGSGDVFEHFHAGHHVEAGGAVAGEVFGGDVAVIDLLAALEEVQPGDAEGFLGEVDAGDLGAPGGHRFGKNAAAAADVDHLLASDAGVVVDPVEAQGVDLVERFELGFGVPPAVGEVTEFLQFGGIGVHEAASGVEWAGCDCIAIGPRRSRGLKNKKPCRAGLFDD